MPLSLLLALGIVLPALIAAQAHAFDIPRNDDWAYRRVLEGFVQTGRISFVGWGAMTLVGQILWAAPFVWLIGGAAWVPGFAVAVLAAIGLAAACLLARCVTGPGRAAATCFLLVALPGFALSTSSFMTDVPAFAAAVACLYCGARAAQSSAGNQRWAWFVASLLVGVFSFSIREFDLAAPFAVLVGMAWRDRAHLRWYAVAGMSLLAACGGIYAWVGQLPGVQSKSFGLPTTTSLSTLLSAFFTLSFFVSPFLPSAITKALGRPRAGAVGAGALCLGGGVWLLLAHHPVLVGNYLTTSGPMGPQVLTGYRPLLFSKPVWDLFEGIALAAGVGLAFVAFSRPGGGARLRGAAAPELIVRAFVAFTSLGFLLYVLFVKAAFFDRYLWALAFALPLLLRPGPWSGEEAAGRARHRAGDQARHGGRLAPARALAAVLAFMICAIGVVTALNGDAYDGARWTAGVDAVRAGFNPKDVDAGFEWVGSHQAVTAVLDHRDTTFPAYETWYGEMFPGFTECALVSGSTLQGGAFVLLKMVSYKQLLFGRTEPLYIYEVKTAGCRP